MNFNFGCSATHSEECPGKGNCGKMISFRKTNIYSLQPTKSLWAWYLYCEQNLDWYKTFDFCRLGFEIRIELKLEFWHIFLQIGSLYSTLALSVERYIAVVHPFTVHRSSKILKWKMNYNTPSQTVILGAFSKSMSPVLSHCSEIRKTSSTCYSIPVALEPITNYRPYSIIRARALTNNSRIYAGASFSPAIL